MANANGTTSRSSKRSAGYAQSSKPAADQAIAASITPSEQRLLRIFAAVPENQHPTFFQLIETICYGCNWQVEAKPALRGVASKSTSVINASSRFGFETRGGRQE